jgi:hypothetical protein
MMAVEPADLLGALPGGALLARTLHLLAPADRRQEFIGDLIEEARSLRGRSPSGVALWLWSQTLRSAPALLAGRVRAVARQPPRLPLSLAFSLCAHALVLCLAVGWAFARADEIAPAAGQPTSARLSPDRLRSLLEQSMLTRVCVGARGDVSSVDVLRGIDLLADLRGHDGDASCYTRGFSSLH